MNEFTVEVQAVKERPYFWFHVRCTACKHGMTIAMMTVARAFMCDHKCGICMCCKNTTIDGSFFCGSTCISQGGGCTHPLDQVLTPTSKKKEPSIILTN